MITVVSGLPRSGTSLMMQMIKAGGMPVLSDDSRKPDDNNPRGYYEYSRVKSLPDDVSWLREAEGKAIKVIADTLFDLPTDLKYNVVFMMRNLNEVIDSQHAVLESMGRAGAPVTDAELKRAFEKHLEDVRGWLDHNDAFNTLYVDHHTLIADPVTEAERVNAFLGGSLDSAKMTRVVDQDLYHARKAAQ